MITKENQRRKKEDSKGERESRGYVKTDRQKRKIENRRQGK